MDFWYIWLPIITLVASVGWATWRDYQATLRQHDAYRHKWEQSSLPREDVLK